MRSGRKYVWISIIVLFVAIGSLVAGCHGRNIVSCIQDQGEASNCNETPLESTEVPTTNGVTPIANTEEANISIEKTETPEACNCEDLNGTIVALQETVYSMNATIDSLTTHSSQMVTTTTLTETLPPSATETEVPTSTPSPTTTETATPSDTLTPTATYTPSLTFTPSATPTITPSPTRKPNASFSEEFADNNQQWELQSGVNIEDGALRVTGIDELKLVKIPLEMPDEFYIEIDTKLHDDVVVMNTNIVFAFGDLSTGEDYNYITFNKDFVDVFQVVDGRSRFISSIQTPIESFSTWQRIGISYNSEQLEVYLNSDIVMITQISSSGGQLAVGGQFGKSAENNIVFFDYLAIFPSRH